MRARPGELDQRITLRRLTLVDDGMGGSAETWADFAVVSARVRAGPGRESQQGDQIQAAAQYSFVIRYLSGILQTDLIRFAGVDYNIRSINDEGNRAAYLEILAERGVAQ